MVILSSTNAMADPAAVLKAAAAAISDATMLALELLLLAAAGAFSSKLHLTRPLVVAIAGRPQTGDA